jgi:hypothetical protein
MNTKCLVRGCLNTSDQGHFEGPICLACVTTLRSGRPGVGASFVERDMELLMAATEVIRGLRARLGTLCNTELSMERVQEERRSNAAYLQTTQDGLMKRLDSVYADLKETK